MQLALSELAFAIYNAIKDPEGFEKIQLKAKIGGEKFKLYNDYVLLIHLQHFLACH